MGDPKNTRTSDHGLPNAKLPLQRKDFIDCRKSEILQLLLNGPEGSDLLLFPTRLIRLSFHLNLLSRTEKQKCSKRSFSFFTLGKEDGTNTYLFLRHPPTVWTNPLHHSITVTVFPFGLQSQESFRCKRNCFHHLND